MKKAGVLLLLVVYCSPLVFASHGGPNHGYRDNFQSYNLGINTLQPHWVPQYPLFVEVMDEKNNKFVRLNSMSSIGGDRDLHIVLNETNVISLIPQNIDLQWSFKVTDCNSTWKLVEGIAPQGANGYLYYHDPNNFVDGEFKIFANNSFCGSGNAQLSAFKRINGISTPLIPYTTFPFSMNTFYTARLSLKKLNSTHYNYTIYLNGDLLANSLKVALIDVSDGTLLLENAGTKTNFDSVIVKTTSFN